MGLCGYNEKIGAGVVTIVDGMVHAMVTKELAQTDFRRTLEIELEELRVSNGALEIRPEPLGHLDGFLAINRFAQVLFGRAYDHLSASGNWTATAFSQFCTSEALRLIDAMREIDRMHRSIKATEDSSFPETLAIARAISQFIEGKTDATQEMTASCVCV